MPPRAQKFHRLRQPYSGAKYSGAERFNSMDDLLADKSIDAVLIATPAFLHPEPAWTTSSATAPNTAKSTLW
jgi:predicted dehydrogenase